MSYFTSASVPETLADVKGKWNQIPDGTAPRANLVGGVISKIIIQTDGGTITLTTTAWP